MTFNCCLWKVKNKTNKIKSLIINNFKRSTKTVYVYWKEFPQSTLNYLPYDENEERSEQPSYLLLFSKLFNTDFGEE